MTISVSILIVLTVGILEIGNTTRDNYILTDALNMISRELTIPELIVVEGSIAFSDKENKFCELGDYETDLVLSGGPVYCEHASFEDDENSGPTSIANFIKETKANIIDWLTINNFSPSNFIVTIKPIRLYYESNISDSFIYLAIKEIKKTKVPITNISFGACADIMVKINIGNIDAKFGNYDYLVDIEDFKKVC